MKWLEFSPADPGATLAADEWLLDEAEAGRQGECLRLWEPDRPFVVVGYAEDPARETRLDACAAAGVPVLRRLSGGGTILQQAGCLNYSLVLRIQGPMESVTATNAAVLNRVIAGLRPLLEGPVERQGATDLTWRGRKFSGNAQRRRRNYLLFHGTLLGPDFELERVERFLPLPSRLPDYRAARAHRDFLTLLPVPVGALKNALRSVWQVEDALAPPSAEALEERVRLRYGNPEWCRGKLGKASVKTGPAS